MAADFVEKGYCPKCGEYAPLYRPAEGSEPEPDEPEPGPVPLPPPSRLRCFDCMTPFPSIEQTVKALWDVFTK